MEETYESNMDDQKAKELLAFPFLPVENDGLLQIEDSFELLIFKYELSNGIFKIKLSTISPLFNKIVASTVLFAKTFTVVKLFENPNFSAVILYSTGSRFWII